MLRVTYCLFLPGMVFHVVCFQTKREVSFAQVVVDYVAKKDGELNVSKGDIVQVLGCTGLMCRVCRQSNDQSTVVEGLLPNHVLMTKDITDNGFR